MYNSLASVYDYFVNWKSRLAFEKPFLLENLSKLGKDPSAIRVMETACGTGQHALALAREGYSVSGSDLSPQMVEMASAHARESGLAVPFRIAGFGQIALVFADVEKFDAVLCLGNSLPHVHDCTALNETLWDFNQLLIAGGVLILQMRNFNSVLRTRNRWMDPQSVQEKNEEWLFFRFYDFEPDGMIRFNILTLHREKQTPWVVSTSSTLLYPILSENLTTSLKDNGFTNIHLYGDMKADSYHADVSGDLVVTAQKI